MLSILQAKLQQYVNWELPDVQLGFGKVRRTRYQIANICWIIEKAEFQKNIYFCFIDYAKVFDCVDHNKLWKILKRWEYQTTWPASWEICIQVKKQQLELDMEQLTGLKLGKEYIKAVYCHPAHLYAEYIMRNAGVHEAQVGIKIAGRNINNIRYAEDTTLMAESKMELKCWWKWKRRVKNTGLKLNIQKTRIMASSPITSWQIDGETVETVLEFGCFGLQNHCRWWLQPWN